MNPSNRSTSKRVNPTYYHARAIAQAVVDTLVTFAANRISLDLAKNKRVDFTKCDVIELGDFEDDRVCTHANHSDATHQTPKRRAIKK
jgi:hypothetical protein